MRTSGERVKKTTNPTLVESETYFNQSATLDYCPLSSRNIMQSHRYSSEQIQLSNQYRQLKRAMKSLEAELMKAGLDPSNL